VRAREQEETSAGVPEGAKQAEETGSQRMERWGWVEPAVWTERMLAALEHGVKGGRWFSLMDKVYAERTLGAAWERVRRNEGAAGIDRQSVAAFAAQAERYLEELAEDLRAGRYQPQPVRRVWIPKPGRKERRPLGIPTVKDRIVQTALKVVQEPIWEVRFGEQSYGFRPGRGCKDALRRVAELLDSGAGWVVEVDLKSYFDTIPHEALMHEVEGQVADGRVLGLVRSYLRQGVMEGLEQWHPEAGTPQGAVISPLLANVYLDPLDKVMGAEGWQMVRYADDMVVLCQSQAEAEAALEALQGWAAAHGLRLHPEKTGVVEAKQRGFDFLGYHFERGKRWPSKRSEGKLRSAIRAKTGRKSGDSMAVIITAISRTLRGWYEYFKHSHKTTFPTLDGWVRMRLRSILRYRNKGKGRGRGADHQRWPNRYFAEQGLFTMTAAHAIARQSR